MRVLISGAGIAGSTLAWHLGKAGARVTVVEKAHALLPHGQNVDIQGSGVTVIKKMGLLEEFRRYNTTEKGTRFIDAKGRPFAPFPIREGSTASFSSEFEILRGDLAKLLYEAAKDQPDVKYVFSTTIKNVISNDDSSVKVELSNGKVQEFDLLVAADGQWSKVRKQCFSPEDVNVVDKGMYVGYWTIPRLPDDNDWWNIYQALGSRIITLRPDPHGTTRAMFTKMPCNDSEKKEWQEAIRSDRKTQEELFRKSFADAGWQAQRLLDAMPQAPDFYFHPMQQIKMTKWSKCRVICLGDTAYAPTPLTGLGTTLAITGAYILAAELSQLNKGEHPAKALEAYERVFHPFIDKAQEIPWFAPDFAHPETAFKRWLFGVGMSTLSSIVAIPWVRNRMGMDAESNDDGFPLPHYPDFCAKSLQ